MIYNYIVLKNSFGIAIYLDAEEFMSPNILDSDILIVDRIYLRLDNSVRLEDGHIERYICKAIKDLSNNIYGKILNSTVCFYIKSLDYNAVHFQQEGLYCVMRGWISQYHNLNLESINVTYDIVKRSFFFDHEI